MPVSSVSPLRETRRTPAPSEDREGSIWCDSASWSLLPLSILRHAGTCRPPNPVTAAFARATFREKPRQTADDTNARAIGRRHTDKTYQVRLVTLRDCLLQVSYPCFLIFFLCRGVNDGCALHRFAISTRACCYSPLGPPFPVHDLFSIVSSSSGELPRGGPLADAADPGGSRNGSTAMRS